MSRLSRFSMPGFSLSSTAISLASCAVCAVFLTLPALTTAHAQTAKPVTINGKQISESEIALVKKMMAQNLARVPDEQKRDVVLNVLIDSHLLADAALEKGLEKTADFKQQLEWMRLQILRDTYVNKVIDPTLDDASIKQRYEELLVKNKGKERHASHILLKTEDEAKAVIAALDKGEDFAALAKGKSIGPSAAKGGDLGFFKPGQMVPEFDKAVFSMDVGSYSKKPVKTQFGWHVIKVEEERAITPPPFEKVKASLKEQMRQTKLQETIKQMRAAAKIEK